MIYPMTVATFALPLMLSTCFGGSGEPVSIPAPDAAITAPCDRPVALPEDPQVRHWAADRAALVACGERHGAMVAWAEGVTGVPQ